MNCRFKRNFLRIVSLAALLGITLPWSSLAAEPSSNSGEFKPHVIWILLDAARAHNFSCYGYDRPTTPNLDKLAERGVLCELNFSQAVHTKGSVPSYMTGRYFPVRVDKFPREVTALYREPAPGEKLFPEIMAENGYETIFLTTHFWFPPGSRLCEAFEKKVHISAGKRDTVPKRIPGTFEQLNRVLFSLLESPADRPRFIYIHSVDTHFPHVLEPPYDRWLIPGYESERIDQVHAHVDRLDFTESDIEQLKGLYDGSLNYADEQIGVLLEKLKEKGLVDKTVIVVSSDHGEMLGEDGTHWGHKGGKGFREYLIRVPLLMAGPQIPEGKRIKQLSENADIVPTLVDLLGLKTDAEFDGKSMVPLMEGNNSAIHQYVLIKHGEHSNLNGDPRMLGLRSFDFKYELYPTKGSERLIALDNVSPTEPDVKVDHPEVLKAMRDYMQKEIFPLVDAYKNLPTSAVEILVKRNMEKISTSPEAYIIENVGVNRKNRQDNKWSLSNKYHWLWSAWDEDAPPISFRLTVPPGRYVAQLGVFSHPNYLKEKPASAFLVKAEGDTEFKRVEHDSRSGSRQRTDFVDIGVYEITDGDFELILDDADRDHWSILRAFRFVPISPEGEETPEEIEQLEQLKALGYL